MKIRPANQFAIIPSEPVRNQSIGARLGVSRNYRFGYSRPELRPVVPRGK